MWSKIPGDVAKYLYLAAILASAYLCLCPKSFAPQEAFCKSWKNKWQVNLTNEAVKSIKSMT